MQKLQLSIPEPCHENWHQMTPTDKGRFCNACVKEVVDFSMMTDTEVLNYFTTITHEKVCGRALPSQLERTITKPKDPKKRLFWYWNYIVMFFMFFGKGNSAKAQGNTQVVKTVDLNKIKQTDINNALEGRVGGLVIINNKIITGKVIDENGIAISFASVKIKGTLNGVVADANGVYSLRVKYNDILFISGASFKSAEVPMGKASIVNIVLEKAPSNLKEEVITTPGLMKRRTIGSFSTNVAGTSIQNIKGEMQVHVVGQTFVAPSTIDSLYVVDGVITTKAKVDNLNPDDISDIVRLNGSDAAVIFGSEGANGAIIISTRKAMEIKMKEVVVTSGQMMGGIRSFTTSETTIIEKCEKVVDTVKTFVTNLTSSIKIYPNPVQRGTAINISLKLKQTGLHQIEISDAAGHIVLQKQVNATSKESIEKIITDTRWSSGMYYISIIDSKNKLISKSSFVFQ